MDHLEHKYFLTKGQFDAKDREIEELSMQVKRQHRQLEQLDIIDTQQKTEIDDLQRMLTETTRNYKSLLREETTMRT